MSSVSFMQLMTPMLGEPLMLRLRFIPRVQSMLPTAPTQPVPDTTLMLLVPCKQLLLLILSYQLL